MTSPSGRRRAVAWIIAASAIVALVATQQGDGPEPTETNAHVRAVVLFVGDSNVTVSALRIDWGLTAEDHNDNGYVPVMASRLGASIRTPTCPDPVGCSQTDYWKTKLGELLPKVSADAIVNNLGINDTGEDGTETTPGSAYYDQKIDWFMELIPRATPVLWTNLPCAIEPAELVARCEIVNEALAEAGERWPNFELVDWSAVASDHPGYLKGEDDVHLTSDGITAWVELVLSALDDRFPAP